MTDPKGPSKAGLNRFKTVVQHLGSLDMTPTEDVVSWPPTDAESADRTREILAIGIDRRSRRNASVAAQHPPAVKKT